MARRRGVARGAGMAGDKARTAAAAPHAARREQEDAADFLHFLLDQAHEELLQLRKAHAALLAPAPGARCSALAGGPRHRGHAFIGATGACLGWFLPDSLEWPSASFAYNLTLPKRDWLQQAHGWIGPAWSLWLHAFTAGHSYILVPFKCRQEAGSWRVVRRRRAEQGCGGRGWRVAGGGEEEDDGRRARQHFYPGCPLRQSANTYAVLPVGCTSVLT